MSDGTAERKEMSYFKVVSIDMFQTLIDVNRNRNLFWQKVLGKNYLESLADEYTAQWGRLFPDHFNQVVNQADGFSSLKPIFEDFFAKFFPHLGIDFDPRQAAQIQVDIHRLAIPYEDTEIFLETIQQNSPVCLVTDADEEMIAPHLKMHRFDRIFISERLKVYKNDPKNRMFQTVLSHYQITPEKIFHIGDMPSEIIGANKAGLTTCWLNRERKNWNHIIKPDFEVHSLLEAAAILGRPIESIT
jgi:HAD superfamily hydrolase (TIGR01509 family)